LPPSVDSSEIAAAESSPKMFSEMFCSSEAATGFLAPSLGGRCCRRCTTNPRISIIIKSAAMIAASEPLAALLSSASIGGAKSGERNTAGIIVGCWDGVLDGDVDGALVGLLEVGAAVGHSVPLAVTLPSRSNPSKTTVQSTQARFVRRS